ncbi:MAG: ABC transporter substrate-binding protein [Lachnospiraceae bacterium]|nr:ABC transporter substrate-binding protein [Lachnospiraceae bacterium]
MSNNIKKKVSIICMMIIITIMSSICVGCGDKSGKFTPNKDGLVEITMCLDWTPNTNHTGFYVADALGYYKEVGIQVKIVQPPEGGAAQCAASGQAQFAIDAQDTIAAAFDMEKPLEVTAVAAILQHNTSCIIGRTGEGMDKPKGLEGKKYSTWDSPIELAMIEHVMKETGADFGKVTLIPNVITDEPAALSAKQTDAVWVFYGWSGINAVIQGVELDTWYFKDFSEELDYYTPIIIANNDFLRENPKLAKDFMSATKRGYEYAVENPSEAAKMLIEGDETGSLKTNEELVYKSQEWISKQYIADSTQFGLINEARWNKFYTWLYDNGLTDKNLYGVGFTNQYIE